MLLTLLQQNLGGGPRLYYVIYPSAKAAPSAAQIKAGLDVDGIAGAAAGNESSPTSTQTYTFAAASGLTASTSYRVAFVWSDGTSDSAVVVSDAFSTLSAGGVTVDPQVVAALAATVSAGSILLQQSVAAQTIAAGVPSIVQGSIGFDQIIGSATVSAGSPSIVQGAIAVVQAVGAQTVAAGTASIVAGQIQLAQEVAAQALSAAAASIVQGSIQLPGSVAAQVLETPNPIIVQGLIDFPQEVAARVITVTPVLNQGTISLIAAPAVPATTITAPQASLLQSSIIIEGSILFEFQPDAFNLSYAAAWRGRSRKASGVRPTLSGVVAPGNTLTASVAGWMPGSTYAYQWLVDGDYVRNATTSSFTVRPQDAGKTIVCCITANAGGGVKVPFVARIT